MAINSNIQILRGTTEKAAAYTGLIGELVYDTTKKTVRAMDGTTAGGSVLAKEAIKLKTDSDNLVKFNGAAEADHAADIEITIDKEAISQEVLDTIKEDDDLKAELAEITVETIKADDTLKGDVADAVIEGIEASDEKQEALAELLADNLVSSDEDNALVVGSDNKLFVEQMDVEALVKSDDAILSVADDKIQSTLNFSYTVADGKFTVTGVGGATIFEETIPTSLTLLKTAEVVTDPAGKPAGTYLHFVFDLQSGQESEVYVDVTSFIDIYTPGNGLQMNADDDHKFEVALTAAGNQARFDSVGGLLVPTDYGTLD